LAALLIAVSNIKREKMSELPSSLTSKNIWDSLMASKEYLRRNLQVAKVVGAHAAAESALKRLAEMKKPPKWIVDAFMAIESRTESLSPDLAAYRDQLS